MNGQLKHLLEIAGEHLKVAGEHTVLRLTRKMILSTYTILDREGRDDLVNSCHSLIYYILRFGSVEFDYVLYIDNHRTQRNSTPAQIGTAEKTKMFCTKCKTNQKTVWVWNDDMLKVRNTVLADIEKAQPNNTHCYIISFLLEMVTQILEKN